MGTVDQAGVVHLAVRAKMAVPGERELPMPANHFAPFRMICGVIA